MKPATQILDKKSLAFTTVATIGLVTLVNLYSCRPDQSDVDSTAKNGGESRASSPQPLLEDWGSPKAVLVFSGDEHGYLEPCGCSERQSGGFARRADLFQQLREKRNWPVTAFDVGGILDQNRVTYQQSKIKFDKMLDGFNRMGYRGLALGKEELMLGTDSLYTQHNENMAEEGYDVPFLSANVTFYGTKELGTPINSRIVDVGDTRIGVVAITGNSTKEAIANTGLLGDETILKIDDPAPAIEQQLAELKEKSPDLLVLLSHATIDESEALAKQFPDFQVVVTANSAEDPKPEPEYVDKTMIVHVGKKGKNVAVVGLFEDGKLKHELVELDMDRFGIHPEMVDLMQEYQNRLEEAWPELIADGVAIADPPGGGFAGAESCKDCHTYAYGIWSKTRHAHAYQSLIEGREGREDTWVSRIYDPECICCHTTGWEPQSALRYKSGFVDMQQTPLLAGQQCENCHGPASDHVAFEKQYRSSNELTGSILDARKALQLNLTQARENVCIKCHDYANSPNFNFDTYWPKVNHSGRKD